MGAHKGNGLNYRSWVEVDLDNFTHNWHEIRKLVGPDVKILSVVKADAYGHGAIEISNVALKNGATYLGVANADEGVQLRVGGIDAPILILSPSMGLEIDEIIKYNLTPSVSDIGFARELQKKLKKAQVKRPIHVEVDTGMGRGGTIHSEAFRVIEEILELPNLAVEGIFTHLSSSEVEGDDYNERQWRLFRALLNKLEENRICILKGFHHHSPAKESQITAIPSGTGILGKLLCQSGKIRSVLDVLIQQVHLLPGGK